jgi:hypothetical protein
MQMLAAVSFLFVAGFIVLTYIVIASPGRSIDNPGGFSPGFRALTVAGCLLVTVVFAAFTVGGLRVALIIDDVGLTIRNPFRTTKVRWDSRPRFETRDRAQDVTIQAPITTNPLPRGPAHMTYRYREIICVVDRQRIWIAATSRMTQRDRVDDLLSELRRASGQAKRKSASHAESAE